MANKKTSEETPASTLSGTEQIRAVQGGGNVYLTPAQIKTLFSSDDSINSVSISGSPITLNLGGEVRKSFKTSANITTNKSWALSNASNAVLIPILLISTNAAIVHTFPSNFTMSDARWDSTGKTWTPFDSGVYEFKAVYDGINWRLTVINGPFS